MKLEFASLADRPDAVSPVAGWWRDEWGLPARHESMDDFLTELRNLDPEQLPLHLVAVNDEQVVGVATLKSGNDMQARFPGFEYWLSGVYVPPAFRQMGIATALCRRIIEAAKQKAIANLYLQTEALDGGLYAKLGWKPVKRVLSSDGLELLVMARDVSP